MQPEFDLLSHLSRGPSLSFTSVDASLLKEPEGKVRLDLASLKLHDPIPVDTFIPVFMKNTGSVQLFSLFPAASRRNEKVIDYLLSSGVRSVFMPRDQLDLLVRAAQQRTSQVLRREKVPTQVKARFLYENARVVAAQVFEEKSAHKAVKSARTYLRQVDGFIEHSPQAAYSLVRMLVTEYSLYHHAINVGLLALCFARFLGMGKAEVLTMGLAGLYHDLGKVEIDKAVLLKPGPLTAAEWEVMRSHPGISHRSLASLAQFPADGLEVVHQHHESLDGSGYPDGAMGERINPGARLLKIVDCYDALTSERCYKRRVPPFQAIRIMQGEMKGQLWPRRLTDFVSFLGSFRPKA